MEQSTLPTPGLLPAERMGRVRRLLAEARAQGDMMRDSALSPAAVIKATRSYTRIIDKVGAELAVLETIGALRAAQAFLDRDQRFGGRRAA